MEEVCRRERKRKRGRDCMVERWKKRWSGGCIVLASKGITFVA